MPGGVPRGVPGGVPGGVLDDTEGWSSFTDEKVLDSIAVSVEVDAFGVLGVERQLEVEIAAGHVQFILLEIL